MGKISCEKCKIKSKNCTSISGNGTTVTKTKRARKSIPRDALPKRSSIYRGVTRHRWTGRYEAHLWDKNYWNETQNKKGRQVYLGAYDDEEAAAHAYDLTALKYWGQYTLLNFPLSTYEDQIKEMEVLSQEEYIGSIRRKSSGFSRGVSKYRGVARHHHNGRWEARIGRVFSNKYLYLGTYATQEEAATAYDMAAVEYKGLKAVTNFDLSRYIKGLNPKPNPEPNDESKPKYKCNPNHCPELHTSSTASPQACSDDGAIALTVEECPETPPKTSLESSNVPQQSFSTDIQTFFDCQENDEYVDEEDGFFGDLTPFAPLIFQCEL